MIWVQIFWDKQIVKTSLLRAWVSASPKSLDGGEKINSILNFCDSPEGIYDAFINPKYKVGEQFLIFMELNGFDLGRNGMGVQDAEHQLLRGEHRLDHQEHLWSSLPLHCRHVQQHFVSQTIQN